MNTYTKQIKKNVWKWKNENGVYSVKKYASIEQAEKIRYIHHELQRIEEPFVLPIIPSSQEDFVIQPWFKSSRTVSYRDIKDRTEVYSILNRLHNTASIIDWKESEYLQPFNLVNKWHGRLLRIKDIINFIEGHMGHLQTRSLLLYGEIALANIQPFDNREQTILHGDVVHHNFLSNGTTYKIIDFDLAVLGPREMEYILWIHRVLPELDYQVDQLLNEFPVLEEIIVNYKEAVMYPNEIFREWLYAYALPEERKKKFIDQLIPYTNKALTNWPKLCYNLSRL